MNLKQLQGLGIALGVLVLFLLFMEVRRQTETGEINWYYFIMGFGMILLLFYTFWKPGRRRRR